VAGAEESKTEVWRTRGVGDGGNSTAGARWQQAWYHQLSYQYLYSHIVHNTSSIECHNATPVGGYLVVWWVLLVESRVLSGGTESRDVREIPRARHKCTSARACYKTALTAEKTMRLA